jgi:hypothetical protein
MSEWQPIEAAPKDGRPVLVWDGSDWSVAEWSYSFRDARPYWLRELGPIYKGVPIDDVGNWICRAGGEWAAEGDDLSYIEPTHWMPLPDPPNGAMAQRDTEIS